MKYRAERCGCGIASCQNWYVHPNLMGVSFDQKQAEAVAKAFNAKPRLFERLRSIIHRFSA